MTPGLVLQELEKRGLLVRVVGDRLRVSPAPVPPDIDELIRGHRDALVAFLQGKCSLCGEPLRTVNRERYTYRECGLDPVHYAELVNRTGGQPMGIFTDYAPNGECVRCGRAVETFNQVCQVCHRKAEGVQAEAAEGQG